MNKQEQELRKKGPIQIRNKKASFEYFFVDTYTAGIVLTGTESSRYVVVRLRSWTAIVTSTRVNSG